MTSQDKIKKRVAVVMEPAMEVVTLGKSQPSVLLKVDKDGKRSYEVKCYADSLEEAGKLARLEAKKLDKLFMGQQ